MSLDLHRTDFIACDVNREKLDEYGLLEYECDIQGETEDGEWVEHDDVPVSDLDMKYGTVSALSTGQSARETDRDIEIAPQAASCGFGMSGWGGILTCRER